jgi:hypothetical protein
LLDLRCSGSDAPIVTPYRSPTHRHRQKCTRLDAALPRERVRSLLGSKLPFAVADWNVAEGWTLVLRWSAGERRGCADSRPSRPRPRTGRFDPLAAVQRPREPDPPYSLRSLAVRKPRELRWRGVRVLDRSASGPTAWSYRDRRPIRFSLNLFRATIEKGSIES